MKRFLALVWALGLASLAAAPAADDLASGFASPPAGARPWVYWFWCNGNITKAGITADLEAMQRVGIGGVLIMDVDVKTPAGPVHYGTPAWHDLIKFALAEAARLGLKVNMTNAPGWAGSGGPWNTPAHSEQKLVWTETEVSGPATIRQTLPHPAVVQGYYADIALLAYPTPAADEMRMADFSPVFSVSVASPAGDPQSLGQPGGSGITLPRAGPGAQPYIQVAFARPFTARTLVLRMHTPKVNATFSAELQSSADGVHFTPVRRFDGHPTEVDLSFDAVTARMFRVVYLQGDRRMPDSFQVTSLELSPAARIDDVPAKTLVTRADLTPTAVYPTLAPGLALDSRRIVDLTAKMDAQGRVTWNAPAGKWTLFRLGHTSRGTMNHPAPEGGLGLECDKMSREAVDAHFAGQMQKVLHDAGPLAGTTLTMMHIDSWETGTQNWTARFREEFQARRGYDLLRYLPAMTGRVVDSPEITERFLWDFRETAAELLAENYAGRMEELARAHGLRLSIEAYGNSLADNLTYGARADEPMCEFWRTSPAEPAPTGKGYKADIEMPSVAHVYGKPIVGSEAFTSPEDERWLAWPGSMKALGDWAFCMGINRLVFHRYAMQPWLDRAPGMSMGPYGVHYERTETWWNETAPWHRYLARCQDLLQQGLTVADICYVNVERAPNDFLPPLPDEPLPGRPGYNFDYAPAQAVISRFSVKEGRIVLPDGMSYRVLVLPDSPTMTPALLRKVKQLVAEGATVIGAPPQKSPSLSNYPACDAEVRSLARELWGTTESTAPATHTLGKGRVIRGLSPDAVLAQMGIPPDFAEQERGGGHGLLYIHHRIGQTDAYFVANKTSAPLEATCAFRVTGRQPEFWWPETGRIEPAAIYDEKNGVTEVPIHFDPTQSVFVVFRGNAAADPIVSLARNGEPVLPPGPATGAATPAELHAASNGALNLRAWQGGTYRIVSAAGKNVSVPVPDPAPPLAVDGPWSVTFPPREGAPPQATFAQLGSWSGNANPGIKYFSGTGTYRKTIDLPAERLGAGRRIYLDLGDVENFAEVTLNGKKIATRWKAPYLVDLTGAARAGANDLQIAVTNLWPNRMIGDQQLPPDSQRAPDGHLDAWPAWLTADQPSPTGRFTFTSWELWKKSDALLPSGLLGPVFLRSALDVPMPKP